MDALGVVFRDAWGSVFEGPQNTPRRSKIKNEEDCSNVLVMGSGDIRHEHHIS
jgi:hypothetical protein